MSAHSSNATATIRSSTRQRARAAIYRAFALEQFEQRIAMTVNYGIAPGSTLDIFPLSQILPAGTDRVEVRLDSVPGTAYGTMYRMSGVTPIVWGSTAPNVFMPGANNNRINGGEGFRYVANNLDGVTESIPVRFRNSTGFTFYDDTISIRISSSLQPPSITQQPTTFVQIGQNQTATMTVAASSSSALSYQWFQGIAPDASRPVAGATSATFTTPTLSAVAQYMYWCRVSNADGSVASDTVTVQVATPTTTTMSDVSVGYRDGANSVTVSAMVSPAHNTGKVTFSVPSLGIWKQSNTVVNGSSGNVTLDLPAGTPAGSYPITAEYAAPAGIAGSTITKTLTIERAATTTTVSGNVAGVASTSAQTVNLSATVSSSFGQLHDGSVVFTIRDLGQNIYGSPVVVTLSNGSANATYTLPANTRAGQYIIVASYPGSANFASSTDGGNRLFTQAPLVLTSAASVPQNATSLTINGAGFSNTPSDNLVSFTPGYTGSVTSATATQLVYTFNTPLTSGTLKALVTTRGVNSGTSVQVATIDPLPDLTVAVTHPNNFVAGSNSNVYRVIISNSVGMTASEVVLTCTLPAGMAATALSGSGWTVSQGTGNTVVARRNDTLAAGSSYPALLVSVSVSSGSSTALVPSFVVSGGGDTTSSNNTATDSTMVAEAPSLVVNTSVDVANASDNQVSLREAVASAQRSTAISGFDGWTITRGALSGPTPTVTAGTLPSNDSLRLTAAEGGQANSAWSSQKVNVTSFTTSFTYSQNAGANGADGFAFAFQNAANNATGGGGGWLGVNGVAGAAGIAFNLYGAYGVGFKTFVNGTLAGSYAAFGNGVSLTNGSPVNFTITGHGTTVTLTATQGSNTFTTVLPIDIAASVGGNLAYVGFTGATGGGFAQQDISAFSLTSAAVPATVSFDPSLAGQTVVLSEAGRNANDDESRSTLIIDNDVTIAGPTSGAGITLAIAAGVQKRHLLVNASGALTVSNLTFTNGSANSYGGAIWSFGSLTVRNSTFTGNYAANEGGAIQTWGGSRLFRLENSTIAGNSTGNTGSAFGIGSIDSSIDHATIVDNNSPNANGAIWIYENSLTMRDSIVARNTNDGVSTNGGNGSGTFSAASSNNIVGVGTWKGLDTASANRLNVAAGNIRLGTLADNGGSTKTIALLPGSPAINAALTLAGVTADQRGMARTQGIAPDIGAYERQANVATIGSIAMEYDSRLAATLNFTLDASVTYSRSLVGLQNLTTNTAVASDVGTFDFDSTGTHATLTLNNALPDGNYRLTAPGSTPVDFFVLRGDFNRDRTVNFDDLLTLSQNYNATGRTLSSGDSNYDGAVDFNDLLALAQNYNQTLPASSTANAIDVGLASVRLRKIDRTFASEVIS